MCVCVYVLVLAEDCQNTNYTIEVRTFWLVPTTLKDCLRGQDVVLRLRRDDLSGLVVMIMTKVRSWEM